MAKGAAMDLCYALTLFIIEMKAYYAQEEIDYNMWFLTACPSVALRLLEEIVGSDRARTADWKAKGSRDRRCQSQGEILEDMLAQTARPVESIR